MQTDLKQLKRQQQLLNALGYYHGKIDGIWGPKSIAAKREFESSRDFVPGIPNNGMPFQERPPYPAGIVLGVDKLLWHPTLDVQKLPKKEIKETHETTNKLEKSK